MHFPRLHKESAIEMEILPKKLRQFNIGYMLPEKLHVVYEGRLHFFGVPKEVPDWLEDIQLSGGTGCGLAVREAPGADIAKQGLEERCRWGMVTEHPASHVEVQPDGNTSTPS
ncbi:hypothetical protein NDU88_007392 [Pleurodeles waltl]|uniref:Uncharacterized protein n=1 Tax=Pleurodeles waltl TaxID=8319 RepID=A0AAV7UNP3_PLEWA|nr:hypothetical protein NDU88_007392 [Pleurodeles waltl]